MADDEPANPNNPFNYDKGWTEIDNGKDKDPTLVEGPLDPNAIDELSFMEQYKQLTEAFGKGDVLSLQGAVMDLAGNVASAIVDPITWLVSNGLGFLIDWIQPLEDALGLVTGNPERIEKDADKWKEVGKELTELAKELHDTVKGPEMAQWVGQAGDAARDRLDQFATGILGMASEVQSLGMILEVSKVLMEVAQALILDIIAQFVTWLIITWLAALAAAAPTLGASTAAAGAATAGNAAVATSRVSMALTRIVSVMGRLKTILQKLAMGIRRYYARMARLTRKYDGVANTLNVQGQTIRKRPFVLDFAGWKAESAGALGGLGYNLAADGKEYLDGRQSEEDIEKGLKAI
ncbi:WXG100 family type VII secretion target [Longispora albida]|uniref:WXG100 family type VII secretion target n=1 Tax=Longispora albida TaxID=203523 RepID=UPI000360F3C0|nr:hypothetical protein [Longispora albida]